MAKELKCRDLGIACDTVIRADTEDELIRRAAQHALTVHGIDLTAPEMLEELRAVVRSANPTW